ncbi:hypothetical protein WLQ65_03750 [Pseudoalteromonas piscicida]|uniref:hypothetical protein n=1 Tax=Pseudoalteromonas piscicida TaxID=43662 RepID=UPI0030C9705D
MADPNTLQDAVSALNQVATGQEQLLTQFQGKQADIEANNQAMQDWQTQPGTVQFKDVAGNTHNIPTLKALVEDAQTVNPTPHVMTKAEFDALRELRKQQYAGSGFVEWGKQLASSPSINEGLWERISESNTLRLGAGYQASGSSKTLESLVSVDGVLHHISQIVNNDFGFNNLLFPNAPDGTKTYDQATGTVTQHSNAEVAFASETDTNKVITSRKDLVFLESWHEKIADKDVVYPLGNVQYGASNYQGIALLNNLVAQGYSAFGEWDSNTKGYGVKWSSLTDEQKAVFLGEPEHNIYYDPKAKAYIQVRYRMRVIEGYGNNWLSYSATESDSYNPMRFDAFNRVQAQGSYQETSGFGGDTTIAYRAGAYPAKSDNTSNVGCYVASGYLHRAPISLSLAEACVAIPIALIQRLNQGAYHPQFNPFGCGRFLSADGTWDASWSSLHAAVYNGWRPQNTSDCFLPSGMGRAVYGAIATAASKSGRSDNYKFYDAIYAGLVEDLRLNANKLEINLLLKEKMKDAILGRTRGKQKVPFTYFEHQFPVVISEPATYNPLNVLGSIQFKIEAGSPAKDSYLSNPNNIGFYIYNSIGNALFLPKFRMSKVGHVHWPYSGNNQDTCYIYDVEDKSDEFNSLFAQGDTLYIGAVRELSPEFDSLPWVDIIGSPENIAATFPDGVVGQWIPEIPDGSSKSFRLNIKLRQALSWTLTTSNGNEWTSGTLSIDEEKNTYVSPAEASRVQLLYYESPANFTAYADNSLVLGNVGEVYSTDFFQLHWGNRLQGSLTNKVNTNSQYNGIVDRHLSLESFTYGQGTLHSNRLPKHAPIVGGAGNSSNGAGLKVLPTVTEKSGLLYLQFHGAELKHQAEEPLLVNSSILQSYSKGKLYRFVVGAYKGRIVKALASATVVIEDVSYINRSGEIVGMESGNVVFTPANPRASWGDDQTIPIISGENTKVDLNGNTVKVFCHHTMFPIGIAHNG